MPYILKSRRDDLDYAKTVIASAIQQKKIDCAGDLNYLFTVTIHEYLKQKGLNYANINEMIGMLECTKLELYRKVAANYEEEKAKINGDINV